MKKLIKLLSVAILGLCVSQLGWAATDMSKKDVVYVIEHTKNLSTLTKAIKAAGLVETLKGAGPFTIFAPTNEAFAALPAGTLDNLLKDKTQLIAVLTYHVVPGKVMAADVQSGDVKTVQGATVALVKNDSGVTVNDAKVVKADIMASNGVIHEIDGVLMPNTATPAPANQ